MISLGDPAKEHCVIFVGPPSNEAGLLCSWINLERTPHKEDEAALALSLFSFPIGWQNLRRVSVEQLEQNARLADWLSAESYYVLLVEHMIRAKNAALAERACKRAIELHGGLSASLHHRLGRVYALKADWQAAKIEYEKACILEPSEAIYHASVADAALQLGNEAAAEVEVLRAIEIDGASGDARAVLADLHNRKGEYQNARQAYEKALELGVSSESLIYTNLAAVCDKIGDMQKAVEYFRKAIALDPDDARWLANLGTALLKLKDFQGAAEQYRTALSRDPSFWQVFGLLGSALLESKNYEESVAAFERGFGLSHGEPWWHFSLGQALLLLGRRSEAIREWQIAVTQDPTQAQWRGFLEELQREERFRERLVPPDPTFCGPVVSCSDRNFVVCPHCSHRFFSDFWVCVNAEERPDLRDEALRSWEAFNRGHCSQCGRWSVTPTCLVYVDAPRQSRIMCFREEYPRDSFEALARYRSTELPLCRHRPMLEFLLSHGLTDFHCVWGYDELWEMIQALEIRHAGAQAYTIREAAHAISQANSGGEVEAIINAVVGMPKELTLHQRFGTTIHVFSRSRGEPQVALRCINTLECIENSWPADIHVGLFAEKIHLLWASGRLREAVDYALQWSNAHGLEATRLASPVLMQALEMAEQIAATSRAQALQEAIKNAGFEPPSWLGSLKEAQSAIMQNWPDRAQDMLASLIRDPTTPEGLHHLIYSMMGHCKRQIGDYPGARACFEKGCDALELEMIREGHRSSELHTCAIDYKRWLARCDIYLGDYEAAERALKLCLSAYAAAGHRSGVDLTLNQLGNLFLRQKQYEKAVDTYRQARTHSVELGSVGGAAISGLNIAVAEFRMGLHAEAEAALDDLLPDLLAQEAAEPKVNALGLKGELLMKRGERLAAEESLKKALAIAQEQHLSSPAAGCLEILASLARTPCERLERSTETVRVLLQIAENATSEPERLHLMRSVTTPAFEALEAALEVGDPEKAWQNAQLMKAPVLSELMLDSQARLVGAGTGFRTSELRHRLASVALTAAQLEHGEGFLAEEQHAEALYLYAETEKHARAKAGRMGQWRSASLSSDEVIHGLLREDTAALDLIVRESDICIFAFTHEGMWIRYSDRSFGWDALERHFKRLYGTGLALGFQPDPSFLTNDLWRAIVEPVAELIVDKKRVIVAPHAFLHFMPLHAARKAGGGGDGEEFLVDSKVVSYVPSLAVGMACSKRTRPDTEDAFVFADSMNDLAVSAASAVKIGKTTGARVLVGRQCTSKEFLNSIEAKPLNFLHVSCHGSINATNAVRSGIHMADRVVTAAEIFACGIDCDLVFLNSCWQGSGFFAGSGELLGMVRSFLHAGARSVISALWPVSASTAESIALSFYEGWKRKGLDKGLALREALKQHRSDLRNWAAFRLHGAID